MDAASAIRRETITEAAAALFSADSVKQIPERFIRTDEIQAAGAVIVGDDETFELPVVDMAKLLDPETSASETAKLGSACRDWGFFQLTSHGVDEAVVQRMQDSAAEFFRLPLQSKNAIAVPADDIKLQGYGYHYSRGSGRLDWAECVILVTQPVHGRKPELWSPSFRDALDEYSTEITNLERRLLGFMAIDLGVSQEALLGAFFSGDADKGQSIIMNHYPPCRHPEKVLGIRPHTDGLGLTVLLHVDDTPGLQIRRRGGRWLPVRPLQGAFVVNVADILEVLTNGAYVSVEHRVVPDAEKCRTTVVLFQDASVDGVVTPLPELLGGDEAQEARYNSIGKLEYGKSRFGAVAEGTRFLDSLKK